MLEGLAGIGIIASTNVDRASPDDTKNLRPRCFARDIIKRLCFCTTIRQPDEWCNLRVAEYIAAKYIIVTAESQLTACLDGLDF